MKIHVPTLKQVHAEREFRYFAHRVETNDVYSEKLIVTAMPSYTDESPKVVGWLVVVPENGYIEWIEVIASRRRRRIGATLIKVAKMILGKNVCGNGATAEGDAFMAAFDEGFPSASPVPPAERVEL